MSNEHSNSLFPRLAVIEACKSCLADIEQDRLIETTRAIEKAKAPKKKYVLWGPPVTPSDEEAVKLASYDLMFIKNLYSGQYNSTKAILAMAEASKEESITVTAHDFRFIAYKYNKPA